MGPVGELGHRPGECTLGGWTENFHSAQMSAQRYSWKTTCCAVAWNERGDMDYPMHPDLKVGNTFPDFELPDQDGKSQKLSKLIRGFPTVLIFSRGYY